VVIIIGESPTCGGNSITASRLSPKRRRGDPWRETDPGIVREQGRVGEWVGGEEVADQDVRASRNNISQAKVLCVVLVRDHQQLDPSKVGAESWRKAKFASPGRVV
jgi:hypothetical protein